jgi:glutamate racemase
MSNENLIYLADSEYTPYGNKSEQQIELRVLAIAEHLLNQNVKALVVACNTATAAAIETLRNKYAIPVIGLEPALKTASENTTCARVGVLATQSTLDSQKYQDLKGRFGQQLELVEKASPLFVELVENAPVITSVELALIEKELAPFKRARVDSLVLGCTHYPFLTETISSIMGPNVTLFESGLPVAKELQRRLQNHCNNGNTKGSVEYYSSNPQKSQAIFDCLLGQSVQIKLFP